jgi:hypothetical protein
MSTIVIAFDGLDSELIEKYGLENIKQEEYGDIDNTSGMAYRKTSELFASFITGKTYREHGIKGLKKTNRPKLEFLLDKLIPRKAVKNIRGFATIKGKISDLVGIRKFYYDQTDLNAKTLFEELDNTRAINVPGFNPSIFWSIGADLEPLRYGVSPEETAQYYDEREYKYRKRALMSELDSDILPPRDFLMCHFHRPDFYQHLFGDRDIQNFDHQKLRSMYKEIDELAEEIRERELKQKDTIKLFLCQIMDCLPRLPTTGMLSIAVTKNYMEKIPKKNQKLLTFTIK